MADRGTTAELITRLAEDQRVLGLCGYAVISHGHSRPTFDADIWLDPTLSVEGWCAAIRRLIEPTGLCVVEIGTWREIEIAKLAEVIERDGVVRLMGADQPLDIFRRTKELDASSFNEVWERATPLEDGTRLPDTIHLLVTQQHTGRDKDRMDILFLEQKAETESLEKLATADPAEIRALLDRFLTPKLAAACRHADASVQSKARGYLVELASEGDPFAADFLRDPPTTDRSRTQKTAVSPTPHVVADEKPPRRQGPATLRPATFHTVTLPEYPRSCRRRRAAPWEKPFSGYQLSPRRARRR